jgi:cupin 2 domain-containing protein
VDNLFEGLEAAGPDELFTEILHRPGIRLERIVSTGQTTPADQPYDQDHDEWVLLMRGAARLWIEGEGERSLGPGDCLLIPAGRRHRVTWAAEGEATVWLAVHFEGG